MAADLSEASAIIEAEINKGAGSLPFLVLLSYASGSPLCANVSSWLSSVEDVLEFARRAEAAGVSAELEMVRELSLPTAIWRTCRPRLVPLTKVTSRELTVSGRDPDPPPAASQGAKTPEGLGSPSVSKHVRKRFRISSFPPTTGEEGSLSAPSSFPKVIVSFRVVTA